MTWLDNYEKQMQGLGLTREIRMARVIRELALYVHQVHLTPDTEYVYSTMVRREYHAYKRLSPDAKEMCNE